MVISWNQLDESTHASDFSGHPRLQRFWDHESTQAHNSEARTLRCLQLSFFDSGPGLAARAAKLPTLELDLDVERDWLLKCLRKNTTSKKQAGAGHGLPAVLMELSRSGGLIRIRSGRHALFNVFDGETASDLFDFADWRHENLAPAAGAVVSLIIPLRRAIP